MLTKVQEPGLDGSGPGQEEDFPPDANRTLYVDCLPQDLQKREIAHIFRPFEGFQVLAVTASLPPATGCFAYSCCQWGGGCLVALSSKLLHAR